MTTSADERPPGERASEWLVRLQHEEDPTVRAEFFAWLRQSPRHVEEFLLVSAAWQALQRFGQSHDAKVTELLAEAAAALKDDVNVVPLRPAVRASSSRSARSHAVRRSWLAAAAVAVVALGVAFTAMVGRGATYATAKGEQRLIRLEDGSVVHLNTDSVLTVRFSAGARDIDLRHGEALFTVQHDAARPFRVHSDATTIQAVGTQFNVYRRPSGTRVSVLEGTVRISVEPGLAVPLIGGHDDRPRKSTALLLSAGQQADASTRGEVVTQPHADLTEAVAWQDQRLIFQSERLEAAVAEVNRYSPRRIRVEGPLKDMRISAIFDTNDSDALLRFLRRMEGVAVEDRRDEVVIRFAEPEPRPAGDARDTQRRSATSSEAAD